MMHHLYPLSKGDQLCPLGFHPQVRWPTRCKRCFRDYKEHGGRRGIDDVAISSPNLSANSNGSQASRTWTSSQNLTTDSNSTNDIELKKRPQSWTSTPDLDANKPDKAKPKVVDSNMDVSISVHIPPRRHTTNLVENKNTDDSVTIRQPSNNAKSSPSPSREIPEELLIIKSDSLAERVRKMNLLKKFKSQNSRESSRERSVPRKIEEDEESLQVQEKSRAVPPVDDNKKKNLPPRKTASSKSLAHTANSVKLKPISAPHLPVPKRYSHPSENVITSPTSTPLHSLNNSSTETHRKEDSKFKVQDAEFLLHPKNKRTSQKIEDNSCLPTETGIQDEMKYLQKEFILMKTRAEKAERDKSDLLLRRLASIDTGPNRTAASEALNLQQKVNEMKAQIEEIRDDKRTLAIRVRELEHELNSRTMKSVEDELRRKLQAAEQLCEELMDENDDFKKELQGMQNEMDEMHDNFREDQNVEYVNLRKEFEATTKNCRILSFKLKKSERKIEQLEQDRQSTNNGEMLSKIKKLEEELRFSNDLAKKLQIEADELKNPGKKRTPMLGVLGKSTSADAKITRQSLTRGGSQEDSHQLLRDLNDSMERESDLKEQLKFAEEEAENLRKKVVRYEDENESLMMQLKKMASRTKSRKLSPTPSRLTPDPPSDRDEGISDEDDPAELRILLELNEQEASILRLKVDDLEKENLENKNQIRELQNKLGLATSKKPFSLLGSSKKIIEEESELKRNLLEKDETIKKLQSQISANSESNRDQELTSKVQNLKKENEKLEFENKNLKFQCTSEAGAISHTEVINLKDSLSLAEKERDRLKLKLKLLLQEADKKLPARKKRQITDLTPKSHLKKWVEELENEIQEMRVLILKSGAENLKKLEAEKVELQKELEASRERMHNADDALKKLKSSNDIIPSLKSKLSDLELKNKKSDEETKKLAIQIKEQEERIKKQDNLIKLNGSKHANLEKLIELEKEKCVTLEKACEKEKKDRERWEARVSSLVDEIVILKKSAENTINSLESDIKDLKSKTNTKDNVASIKQLQELKKKVEELQERVVKETKKNADLNIHCEKLSEENVLIKAQKATEKQASQIEIETIKQSLADLDKIKQEKLELSNKFAAAQRKISDLETKNLKSGAFEYEKTKLKNALTEKEQEHDRLRRENEMNIDLVFQLRKENEGISSKLNDFDRISRIRNNITEHSNGLENEIKSLRMKLENAELNSKSEVASTRLRYEQQVKNLSSEINSMQRQCERFKKDRDTFKQLLESAQKKIADLKANNTGRQSRGSMHSSDNDDDKGKIIYLEQQVGCLEDQLCEVRLEANKLKTELVSERSANEIKISEMQSKLNEFEEERVIGSGRTKMPGVKTKLELAWQKEREDQQRLLQETSTLARDLRQTLFEVERERDKERLETKRKLDQLKRANEEELEEGRKKIAELQCDLLELRDAHAKIRTSNEKLRRERERHEKELFKRRTEQDGGIKKVDFLLQTVDELIKFAPDFNVAFSEPAADHRNRSPSPAYNRKEIVTVLARLADASEELRKSQRSFEDENERTRLRRANLRRAASQENTTTSGVSGGSSTPRPILKVRTGHNGSLFRKSLSLDHTTQQDQFIWGREDGSMSSVQSIESELAGFGRDSSMDSRLSGGSTQSDIPKGHRKKKKSLMGKLRSFTKSGRNSESEISIQGSDSDASIASEKLRTSKKDFRGRLSGMFKRSGSTSRAGSLERTIDSQQRPVAVMVVGIDSDAPPNTSLHRINNLTSSTASRTASKPPTPSTPTTVRNVLK